MILSFEMSKKQTRNDTIIIFGVNFADVVVSKEIRVVTIFITVASRGVRII